jgi:hypothetical protein
MELCELGLELKACAQTMIINPVQQYWLLKSPQIMCAVVVCGVGAGNMVQETIKRREKGGVEALSHPALIPT